MHFIDMYFVKLSFKGLIITGGEGERNEGTRRSIETFPNVSCSIPPFPIGNLSFFSSSYSPPKGEGATPSLSSKMARSWSSAEEGGLTPGLRASLGAEGKLIVLTTQRWGETWSSYHINPFSARKGLCMQQLCCQQQERTRSSSLAADEAAATPVR